jgi:pyridoxal phosphate enzyme (YggS family)
MNMNIIKTRYTAVQERIHSAAQRAGRNPDEITLVAVTKTWPTETILAAYEAGMRHFGENRAEELAQKRPAIEAALGSGSGIVWHQIGIVQSRKTALVADHADVFHALERHKIANRLSRQLQERERTLPIFLEVNVSGEASKAGFNCTNWQHDATQQAQLRTGLATINNLPGLSFQGLMMMAPWGAELDHIRSLFRQTRELAAWLQETMPELKRPLQLSMGMTLINRKGELWLLLRSLILFLGHSNYYF